MRQEAEETERRCTEVADQREGKKTAILEKARETKSEAEEMMSTYLGDESDGLDGFEFMTMAEAAEVGHWAMLGKFNESAGEGQITEFVEWALPIQERHFETVKPAPSSSRPKKIRTRSKGPEGRPLGGGLLEQEDQALEIGGLLAPAREPDHLAPHSPFDRRRVFRANDVVDCGAHWSHDSLHRQRRPVFALTLPIPRARGRGSRRRERGGDRPPARVRNVSFAAQQSRARSF